MAATIWLVEDDESIGAALLRTLLAEGYDTMWATSLSEARTFGGAPDLLILDRGLPDGDGLELCRALLAVHLDLRVLLLTARTEEIDVVLGLDAGASDYVTKPFRLAELLARIRVQLRLANHGEQPRPALLEVGDLVVDPAARQVRMAGQPIDLRAKEFDLLARLAVDAGMVVRREVLMADVWKTPVPGGTKTLDVHVAALRRRLDVGPGASRITTLRGVGYRMERPE